jgi:hypothetical protein
MKFRDFENICKQVKFTLPDDCLDNIKSKAGCARTYKPTCVRARKAAPRGTEGGRAECRKEGRERRKGGGGERESTRGVFGEGW